MTGDAPVQASASKCPLCRRVTQLNIRYLQMQHGGETEGRPGCAVLLELYLPAIVSPSRRSPVCAMT
jgi:hypothetical protein